MSEIQDPRVNQKMHCGKTDFKLVQEAYYNSYLHADVEMLNFLQHVNFFNVRINTVKGKIEFLKLVQLKKLKGSWYASNSTINYENEYAEERDQLMITRGKMSIKSLDESLTFFTQELWIFVPDVSWKILNFIILPAKGVS